MSIHEQITSTVTAWAGISAHPHRFGGTEFVLGEKREIGHIHGDYLVDVPFSKRIRAELVEAGRADRTTSTLIAAGSVCTYAHPPMWNAPLIITLLV